MHESGAGDISVMVRYGDLQVALQAEGVSWSPDVADDMTSRIRKLWSDVITDAKAHGLMGTNANDMEEVDEVG